MQRPKAQNVVTRRGAIYSISEERFEQVDDDVLFLAFGKEGKAIFESLKQRPLWKSSKLFSKSKFTSLRVTHGLDQIYLQLML
ncbi:hypothetical protein [Gloeocapsa sp. PCC 7428]|uniref:hypothetical protein n=1 Tax=Gloeocapsa sp. PCC 7428 TaxID=1173026 RepID=UPI0030DC4D53